MKNLKEFKELILRYESITLEDILRELKLVPLNKVANKLTGFGHTEQCTLCKIIKAKCSDCTWSYITEEFLHVSCNNFEPRDTYLAIEEATTPEELLKAFKARAKYMRVCLSQLIKHKDFSNS